MSWKYKINIKPFIGEGTSNDDIVKAAKGVLSELNKLPSSLYDDLEPISYEFEEIVRCEHDPKDNYDLLQTFNYYLNELYNWADYERIWLGI